MRDELRAGIITGCLSLVRVNTSQIRIAKVFLWRSAVRQSTKKARFVTLGRPFIELLRTEIAVSPDRLPLLQFLSVAMSHKRAHPRSEQSGWPGSDYKDQSLSALHARVRSRTPIGSKTRRAHSCFMKPTTGSSPRSRPQLQKLLSHNSCPLANTRSEGSQPSSALAESRLRMLLDRTPLEQISLVEPLPLSSAPIVCHPTRQELNEPVTRTTGYLSYPGFSGLIALQVIGPLDPCCSIRSSGGTVHEWTGSSTLRDV